jgi:hypothetical protein
MEVKNYVYESDTTSQARFITITGEPKVTSRPVDNFPNTSPDYRDIVLQRVLSRDEGRSPDYSVRQESII